MLDFPATAEALAQHPVCEEEWYYSAELLPGAFMDGAYPVDLPMLPRLMMRNVDPRGMDCLDIGTMEGLIPTLLAHRGGRVLAVDAAEHAMLRLAALRHYHDVDFAFQKVGLLYDLDTKLPDLGFDFVNLSGVLYHVYSPLMTLAAVRPLLKRGAIFEVSTNMVYSDRMTMEFNDAGRLQAEPNTFWYPSVPLFDYLLRMLKLQPIDCMHLDHTQIDLPQAHVPGLHTGYVSVLCRAVDDIVATERDTWMRNAQLTSWEHMGVTKWARAESQPVSTIPHLGGASTLVPRTDSNMDGGIDVWASVQNTPSLTTTSEPSDTHLLRLADRA